MEGRLTVCNMSIGPARAGMIAPDETTFSYLAAALCLKGEDWDRALVRWRKLRVILRQVRQRINLDSSDRPDGDMGHEPLGMSLQIDGAIPDPAGPRRNGVRAWSARSNTWTRRGPSRLGCGRSRFHRLLHEQTIEDLRSAATVAAGRKVHESVRGWVVPGSDWLGAEAEGLDVVFKQAGYEWREAGCSILSQHERRNGEFSGALRLRTNFVGRQGQNTRTHLSPRWLPPPRSGHLTDVRRCCPGMNGVGSGIGGRPLPSAKYRHRPDHSCTFTTEARSVNFKCHLHLTSPAGL